MILIYMYIAKLIDEMHNVTVSRQPELIQQQCPQPMHIK